MIEHKEWGKTARVSNARVLITEKLDGTNTAIYKKGEFIQCASRTRLIRPEEDNHGFSCWAMGYRDELLAVLPEGWTYGEWIGQGIQRNYGLDHKEWHIFSRFVECEGLENVHMVPLLQTTTLDKLDYMLSEHLSMLERNGSCVNGFYKPEGLVAQIGNQWFKHIIDK